MRSMEVRRTHESCDPQGRHSHARLILAIRAQYQWLVRRSTAFQCHLEQSTRTTQFYLEQSIGI
jgi:hypothetical protein